MPTKLKVVPRTTAAVRIADAIDNAILFAEGVLSAPRQLGGFTTARATHRKARRY